VDETIQLNDSTLQIPGYRLERNIGSGAMATVYLATQESLDRQVALKLMSPALTADEQFRGRFLKEGKIVAQLNHPHIVTIYDIGVLQDRYFMAMEYVDGGTLKERISNGLTSAQATTIFRQIAQALGYAHKRGFVHRDVKPANILFREDGSAVLSDFGIAKSISGGTQMTQAGWAVGTPSYMSPEQALAKPVDARSDLYSLGIVFYEMLTGARPYQAPDSIALALKHVNDPIPRLPEVVADYQAIIDQLMAKDPNDRFADAETCIAALDTLATVPQPAVPAPANDRTVVLDHTAPGSRSIPPAPSTGTPLPPQPGHRWLWTLGIGGVLVVALAAAVYFLQPYLFPESTPEPAPVPLPPIACPSLDDKEMETVKALMTTAQAHEDGGYPVYAIDIYHRVLEIDPCEERAKTGLDAIADLYAQMARASLENNEPPAATLELVDIGLSAVPQHAGLLALREQLPAQ